MVKPPHFMDTCLIRTCHYNVQFALFLGKESPYIFPKLNLLNTGHSTDCTIFFLSSQEANEQELLDFKLLLPENSPSAFVYDSNSIICVSGVYIIQHVYTISSFTCVILCYPVFPCVPLSSPVLLCVTLSYPVFPSVMLCYPVLLCVTLCYHLLLCAPLCYSV